MDDLINGLLEGLFDVIFSVMEVVLDTFVGRLLYFAETGLCKIVGMLDQMFQVFAGITKVSYDGEKDYLVNVFFSNHSISNIYWAMALIGIVMVFGFAIVAVARKMFDSSGKMQTSLGQIVTAALRSIILILSMSAIMVIVLNSTNVLMQQINYLFNDPENLDLPETIVYTDEEFAAMGRVLKTIGNYSLNPSNSSRYNINSCFNDIRQDLHYLQQQKVFRYYYLTTDADGNEVNTWQAVLQKVANSHDLRTDLKLDVSYDAVTKALLSAMDIVRNDPTFKPLQSYTRVVPAEGSLPLDRYLFLMGTMRAAKNSEYNVNPELTDPVRGPYYSGEKSIYSISQVSSDFDVGFATDYLVVFLAGIALIFDLVTIILNCIARIFNMLFLYVIAPPIFATQPLDGGGKTKQWMTAFIVQSFSVFGTVIAMRLLLVLLPIVTSSKLVLFESSMMNIMAKLVLMYGLFEVAKKATGLLTGILADSAGWQSVQAGDMSGSAGKLIGGVTGAAKAVGGVALKATGKVADFATKPLQNVAKRGYDATIGKAANAWSNLGKGDVEGQKAMAAAKERLAVDQAYAKLTGGGESGGESGSPAGGSDGEDSGAAGKTLETGSKVAGAAAGALASIAGGAPGSSSGGAPGSGGSGGSGNAGNTGNTGKKTPPPPRDKQGGGEGQKKPLSPQAQKLFGTDASGKVPSGGAAGGKAAGGKAAVAAGAAKAAGGAANAAKSTLAAAGKAAGGAAKAVGSGVRSAANGGGQPLSVKAQNLFGTDANGQVRSKEAPAASGGRPSIGSISKPSGGAKEAPTPRNRSTLDGGGGDQRPFDQPSGGEAPVTGGGLPQNQSGIAPVPTEGGYGSELTGGGNVELGDAGSRPTIEPAPTPPSPSHAQEAPAQRSRPTLNSFESRQSAPAQPEQQTASPGSGGQKPLSQAAQNLFGVDASGRTRTPPPPTRQSASSQAAPSPKSPTQPSPRNRDGRPDNRNGKK